MTYASNAYRQNAARGASPVGQVALLYEQIVADLRRASQAIEAQDIEDRTNAINHAILIVGHLQSKLNFEAGGEVARHLEQFYELARQRLIEAQCQASPEILQEQIGFFLDLRDAWKEAERASAVPAGSLPGAAPTMPDNTASDGGSAGWSA